MGDLKRLPVCGAALREDLAQRKPFPASPLSLILLALGRRHCYGERIPLCQLSSTCREMHQAHLEFVENRSEIIVAREFYAYDADGV
jgi:hypothetical protein